MLPRSRPILRNLPLLIDEKAGISADSLIEAVDDYVENLAGDRRALLAQMAVPTLPRTRPRAALWRSPNCVRFRARDFSNLCSLNQLAEKRSWRLIELWSFAQHRGFILARTIVPPSLADDRRWLAFSHLSHRRGS